jgi:sugar diacid utilization regulator/putative methionine-R-sulfoxide reductase with GAF domain
VLNVVTSADVSGSEEPRLNGAGADVSQQLEGALQLVAHAIESPCELGWLDAGGEPTCLRVGEPIGASWGWLWSGEAAMPRNVAPLRGRDGRLLGGVVADPGEVPARLAMLAPDLAVVLAATLADHDRFAAYGAMIELTSQLHADELNTDEILRSIVERARQLIGVDVTWLGLIDAQDRVAIQVAAGARSPAFVDMWIDVGRGIGGLAVKERRTVVVPDHRLFENASSALVIETMRGEGIVSVLCAPLMFDGRAIGALYGGSRQLTSFSETTIAVFTALTTQAAVSIVNSRLYGALADKNKLLERTLSSHRRLNHAALAGADAHAIAGEVARLIDRPVVVVRESGKTAVWHYNCSLESVAHPTCVDPSVIEQCVGQVPVRAGEEQLGTIGALGDTPLSDFDRNALEQGATIMALELIKERAAWEVEWRLRGELLEEILQQRGEPSEGLQVRAAQFGIDLSSSWTLAVLEPAADATTDIEPVVRVALMSRTRSGDALVARRGARTLVALDAAGGSAIRIIEELLAKAERAGAAVIAGLSAARHELPVALGEAEAVMRLAHETGRSGLVTVEALGPLRYFLNSPGTTEMSAMVDDLLGTLVDYDRCRNSEMMRTLRAYLDSGGHHPTAAAQCHIHTSTLKYRLGRITELLDRRVSGPQAQFELTLAFSTLDALGSLGLTHDEIFTRRRSSAV